MIIKIDHVALNSSSFEKDIEKLNLLGYKPVFIEKNIDNPKIKKDLMKHHGKCHDLALLKSTNNLSIELINHGCSNSKEGYITPILDNISKDTDEIIKETVYDFKKIRINYFDVPIYAKEESNSFSNFNKIVVNVDDIENSIKFWECIGFKTCQKEKNSVLMKFQSFMNNVCWIYLKKTETPVRHFLDDKGFNCLALISNSAEKEREILRSNGFETTDIEEFAINKKTLNIFFSVAPSGELIEIVGIDNKS